MDNLTKWITELKKITDDTKEKNALNVEKQNKSLY